MISLALLGKAACAAGPQQPNRVAFRSFIVQGRSLQGPIQGPWEWAGSVTVTGYGMTMACDRLKLWPTGDARDFDRAEAAGNIVIRGRYAAADKTEWKVLGKAAAATYQRKAGKGMLRGSVSFEATNAATGAILCVVADKLSYDFRARRFRFERGDQPVRVQWQEPELRPGSVEEPVKKDENDP